jgi:hypothetical protein
MNEKIVLNNKRFDFIQNPSYMTTAMKEQLIRMIINLPTVLSFKPRKSKAMYVGKLHVSETDYAVLRTDYVLDEGEKLSNLI